jgi:heme O synthase-like polyprenyltransferase
MLLGLSFALGTIVLGAGLILYFRGKSLIRSEQKKAAGKRFYYSSLFLIAIGGLLLLCPTVILQILWHAERYMN